MLTILLMAMPLWVYRAMAKILGIEHEAMHDWVPQFCRCEKEH